MLNSFLGMFGSTFLVIPLDRYRYSFLIVVSSFFYSVGLVFESVMRLMMVT